MRDLRFGIQAARTVAGRSQLGMFAALAFVVACSGSAKKEPAQTAPAAKVPAEPVAAPALAAEPSGPTGPKPAANEPAELTAIKARVVEGDRSTRTLKELQRLSHKYPKNAEVAYILGQFYCGKLWMKDGLEYFHRAIELDPAFRSNPYLIKSVIAGLGNDGDHEKVQRFLVHEIGQSATPFLEEVLSGTWRQQVKDRATAVLGEIK